MTSKHRLPRSLLALAACASCAVAHEWYPAGWEHARRNENAARGLAYANQSCELGSPAWALPASTTVAAFESFHLHLAYAAGNTAQAAAVAAFKTALIAAGASSTCPNTLSDTSTVFCYSQTITSFTSSSQEDPFYNQDFFAFVGNSYFTTALTFAMRSRMADLAATYNVDVFVHPNSGCPGLDHLRWSLFFE